MFFIFYLYRSANELQTRRASERKEVTVVDNDETLLILMIRWLII